MENANPFAKMRKLFDAYEAMCKPFCNEIGLSVKTFEILMFIAKRSDKSTAQEICKEQNIKPTLISFHIEKLVQAGYVARKAGDDRRSIKLVCTPEAAPVIEKGKKIHEEYSALIRKGVSEEEEKQLKATLAKIFENADKIIAGEM